MMRQTTKYSLAAAAVAVAIAPAQAAELPRAQQPVFDTGYQLQTVLNDGADEADQHRRYRYRRDRDDRIDAADVVAGALIIGGIFAVLSATSKSKNDAGYDGDSLNSSEFDRAVDACVDQVERSQRIGSVDNVGRTQRGFAVSGTLSSGNGFTCQVSGAGRVIDVDYGFGGVTYQSGGETYGDGQFSDEAYARARVGTYSAPDRSAQPAYPGGPIDGDEGYTDEPIDGDFGEPY